MNSTAVEIPDTINGRKYSLWPQFKRQEQEWIGGELQEISSGFPETGEVAATEIVGIEWRENGNDSAWFGVEGKNYSCGFDVTVGGVTAGEEGWLTFSGYGGHTWRIKKPTSVPNGNDGHLADQVSLK